ncbi:hypothetical protein Y032_0013g2181 [Ancylostoma ceylanicum]|uniref:Uncharacterized protein n=1 Tax=Ancylostoma ceylanicum TaxID=53326 RepID=A0A016VDU4_9BILA|nr:hypothetical protein Y032_0013g2181 [Ancylostoma ceylanicum]
MTSAPTRLRRVSHLSASRDLGTDVPIIFNKADEADSCEARQRRDTAVQDVTHPVRCCDKGLPAPKVVGDRKGSLCSICPLGPRNSENTKCQFSPVSIIRPASFCLHHVPFGVFYFHLCLNTPHPCSFICSS